MSAESRSRSSLLGPHPNLHRHSNPQHRGLRPKVSCKLVCLGSGCRSPSRFSDQIILDAIELERLTFCMFNVLRIRARPSRFSPLIVVLGLKTRTIRCHCQFYPQPRSHSRHKYLISPHKRVARCNPHRWMPRRGKSMTLPDLWPLRAARKRLNQPTPHRFDIVAQARQR